jgi:AraC family transcriptional regulator
MDSLGCAPIRSTIAKDWAGIQMCKWHGTIDTCAYDAPDDILLVYHLGGSSHVPVSANIKGQSSISRPGLVSILHRNTSVRWEVDGKFSSLSLHISDKYFTFPPNSDNICERLKAEPALAFRNPFISATLEALAAEMSTEIEDNGLLAESLVSALCAYIERNICVDFTLLSPSVLSKEQMIILYDYIDQMLEQRISVRDLADVVDLPQAEFSKRFYLSNRKTPYQFIIERRINKSLDFLRRKNYDICEIALRCGFSSQSHFSTTFKKILGVTPTYFRTNNS